MAFTYENFGVDQISSYQGKSGQNCKQFVTRMCLTRKPSVLVRWMILIRWRRNVLMIRASAGQQEVTAVLMESFAGATTVVRGNCSVSACSLTIPENVDDALRQRAGARWLVDGPQTRDDYIDIFACCWPARTTSIPLGNHDLFSKRKKSRKAVADRL